MKHNAQNHAVRAQERREAPIAPRTDEYKGGATGRAQAQQKGQNMNDNPCNGCHPPKRSATCHGACERYAGWRQTQDERRDASLLEKVSSGHVTELDYKKRQESFQREKDEKKRRARK